MKTSSRLTLALLCLSATGFSLADNGEVIQAQAGQSRSIPANFMGFNGQTIAGTPSLVNNSAFVSTLQGLNSTLIRFPGGVSGNYWNYQKGSYVSNVSDLPKGLMQLAQKQTQGSTYNIGFLQKLYSSSKIVPLFQMNMISSDLQTQMGMLSAAKSQNVPVNYVELGNELYWSFPSLLNIFPDTQSYVTAANQWAASVHQQYPNAQVSAVAESIVMGKKPRVTNWNANLAGLKSVDALSIHPYLHPIPTIRKAQINNKNPHIASLYLSIPFRLPEMMQDGLSQLPSNLQQLPLWATEYGIWGLVKGKKIPMASTWAQALANSTMTLLLIQNPQVNMIVTINVSGEGDNALIKTSNNSYTAFGRAMQMFYDATNGAKQSATLNFQNAPVISVSGAGGPMSGAPIQYPALVGSTFSGGQTKAVLINLSPTPQSVDLSGVFSGQVNVASISADAVAPIGNGKYAQTTAASNSIVLPGYSVNEITVG